ncbi:hypothetical protein D9615_003697 [Tricholomella constricta]|uniref:Uncharacterized protein n=1 Tax=Tricholomella constricta TaxID=117010 RepID=A0A8H5M7I5_9AGAR|nr:hypothetical protein D9615_003697 [Tricholomella constricta]
MLLLSLLPPPDDPSSFSPLPADILLSDSLDEDNDANRYLHDFDEVACQTQRPPAQIQIHFRMDVQTQVNDSHTARSTQHIEFELISLVSLPAPRSHSSYVAQPRRTVVSLQRQPTISARLALYARPPTSKIHPSLTRRVADLRRRFRVAHFVRGFLFTCVPPPLSRPHGFTLRRRDKLPGTLEFLAVFRAIVGNLYAPVYMYYFGERS